MSFIDKFLDLTAPLPREIVRYLQLLKDVEKRSKQNNIDLQKDRENFLIKLKEFKNNYTLELKEKYDNITRQYKELLTLSNYKKEIIKQIQRILEDSFLSNLEPIIQEGQKECQEQLLNPNYIFNNSPYGTTEKLNQDEYSLASEYSKKRKEDENGLTKSFLGSKKNRTKSLKIRKIPVNEHAINNLPEGGQLSNELFCFCHQPSYGNMIQCENPECKYKWFHYGCVSINEKDDYAKKEWYCSDACRQNAKRLKEKATKKKKKII